MQEKKRKRKKRVLITEGPIRAILRGKGVSIAEFALLCDVAYPNTHNAVSGKLKNIPKKIITFISKTWTDVDIEKLKADYKAFREELRERVVSKSLKA